MRSLVLLPLLLLAGCVGVVKEIKGPAGAAVVKHTRAKGAEISIPSQTGDSVLKIRIGWFSDTFTFLPCSNNEIFTAPVADTHRATSKVTFSGFDDEIIEDVVSGYKGTPPTPRNADLFSPKAKP